MKDEFERIWKQVLTTYIKVVLQHSRGETEEDNDIITNYPFSIMHTPNVVVKWLALPFRIREVPGSNLCPETGYPDWDFSWFSSVPPGECHDSILKLGRFLPNPFQLIIHLSPYHSTLKERRKINNKQIRRTYTDVAYCWLILVLKTASWHLRIGIAERCCAQLVSDY
jgi:hypothetical protein